MVFGMHVRFAKTALSELDGLKIGRRAYIFGNVFPDFILPHIPRHRKQCSHRFFDKQHAKLRLKRAKSPERLHVWDSFMLGVLSHYAADYSCSAHKENHNIPSHREHEKALHMFLKSNPNVLERGASATPEDITLASAHIGNGTPSGLREEIVDAMNAVRFVVSATRAAASTPKVYHCRPNP